MLAWYEKLPEWIRWILFLPLSELFSLFWIFICSFIRDDMVYMRPSVAMISFMFAVYTLAPRAKRALALASVILRMVVSTTLLVFVFIYADQIERRTWGELIAELIGWGLSITLYITCLKNDDPFRQKSFDHT